MTLGNYTQFNMLGMGSGMGYQNFLGGGLGMGMGSFNIGGMLGGCNMFQSCDGSYNYDAMAGYGVASVLTNCLFGFLGQSMAAKQAKKADAPEAKLETLKTQQSELYTKLDNANKAYDKAKEAYLGTDGNGGAKKAYDDNKTILVGYNATEVAETIRLYKAYVETGKQNEYKGTTELPSEADYKKALEQQEAKKNEASLKTAMETAKKAYETAESAKTEAQDAYNAVTTQISELETQLTQETNDKILDNADGHKWQQSKDHFNANGKFTSSETVKKGDVRYAIQLFRNAKAKANNDAQTKECAQQVVDLFNRLSSDDQGDKSLLAAYNIIIQETL